MNLLATLQRWLGFTHTEARVVVFLSATLLAGIAIRWYQSRTPESFSSTVPQFDYAPSDSEFAERSTKPLQPSPTNPVHNAPASNTAPLRHVKGAIQVHINSATKAELMTLPGIGPTYADLILQYRTEHGRFRSIDELQEIKGIGPKKLEKIRPHVIVP